MARTTRTPKKRKDWRPDWLEAFERTGMVTAACREVGVGRTTVYEARANEDFAAAWDAIEHATTDQLEQEARRRAVEGSDTLLIFLLKARRPEMYRETRYVEHAGRIKHEIEDKLDREIDALLAEMAARSQAAASSETEGRSLEPSGTS